MIRCAVVVVLAACSSSASGPHVMMDFTRAHSLYDAPVPADDLMSGPAVDVSMMTPDQAASAGRACSSRSAQVSR